MSDRVLRVQSVLTARDLTLLEWLVDHGVLTSFQIAHALFPSLDFAQRRLTRLVAIGVVDRFRPFKLDGGSFPYHYVIDQLGAEVIAAQRDEPPPRPGYGKARRRRWTSTRTIGHRLGVNGFFTDLAGHARTHPDHALLRWWPESRCSQPSAFAIEEDAMELLTHTMPIHPDGHGIWQAGDALVPFFLEYDTGFEPITELGHKLVGYTTLAERGGASWPVLFWLTNAERAVHLHQLLTEIEGVRVPVATGVREDTTSEAGPAGRVWWLHRHAGLLTLADLATAIPRLTGQATAIL
ncbi:replication-relaxation family protein [Phytohabitans sp. ZYX-F-186]|uniref:Replication-relaxation family protein n=1 Tax=Phytohabitans maris TaxID=3071409 RepID=A0ABU0ZC17_9ACTN|nr:replication-relaxation family protein [Phytohabitans sp. ZYX-F-186]MDQ7903487.1 replication-relaxation family protein [Phytohabitans sp. ZYX-F-186]